MINYDHKPINQPTPACPTSQQTADDAHAKDGNAVGAKPATQTAGVSVSAPFFADEKAFLDHVGKEIATWRGFLIKAFPRLFREVDDFVEDVLSKTLRRCLQPRNTSYYRHFNPDLASFSTWFCWILKGVALDVWKAHCKYKRTWEARHDAYVRTLDDVPGDDQDRKDEGGGTPRYVVASTPSLWTSRLDFRHDCDTLTHCLSPAETRVFQAMRTGLVEYQDIARETGYAEGYVAVLAFRIREKSAQLALGSLSSPQPADPPDMCVQPPQQEGQEQDTARQVRHLDVHTYRTTPHTWMTEEQLHAWHRDALTSTFAPIGHHSDNSENNDVSAMQPRGTYYVQGHKISVSTVRKRRNRPYKEHRCETLPLGSRSHVSGKKFTEHPVRKVSLLSYKEDESGCQGSNTHKKTSKRIKFKDLMGRTHMARPSKPLTESLCLLTIPGFMERWQCYSDEERQDVFYDFDPDAQRPHKGKPHDKAGHPDLAADTVSSAIGPLVVFPYAKFYEHRH